MTSGSAAISASDRAAPYKVPLRARRLDYPDSRGSPPTLGTASLSSAKLLPKVSMTGWREALDGAELDEINDNRKPDPTHRLGWLAGGSGRGLIAGVGALVEHSTR